VFGEREKEREREREKEFKLWGHLKKTTTEKAKMQEPCLLSYTNPHTFCNFLPSKEQISAPFLSLSLSLSLSLT
jgi:hypothetical protein